MKHGTRVGTAAGSLYVVLFCACLLPSFAAAAEASFEPVAFETDDGGTIHASLFRADGKRAVAFAHGAVFNKESWYELAGRMQEAGVTALSIDFRGYGKSEGPGRALHNDVLGAVAFLEKAGYEEIALVGGSMGGAATLRALATRTPDSVKKVALLAPAGGDAIASERIDKLFIVAEGDRLHERVKDLYEASADPKELKVYSGPAHAQHLFKTEHADDLTRRLVDFVSE